MLNAFRLRGARGAIVWGYHTAAALGPWLVKREKPNEKAPIDLGWRLSARVIRADPFQCARHPLYFTAPHPQGQWCFPIATLSIVDGRLSAQLRAPEQ